MYNKFIIYLSCFFFCLLVSFESISALESDDRTVSSLDSDSGITFKIFNYDGDNDETGINNNGIYDYFTFRDSSRKIETKINDEIDGDGFKENRAKVLPKLDSEGYPVFDCQGKCSNNPSLGY